LSNKSTWFRGRGDAADVHPFSFREYFDHIGGDKTVAFEEYAACGGMPMAPGMKPDEAKFKYLRGLFEEVYHRDIQERRRPDPPEVLDELIDVPCSATG